MRRTRVWWARLTKEERSTLVFLERARQWCGGSSAYLPDDVRECPACGQPQMRSGLCNYCYSRLETLIAKGNGQNATLS